MRLEDFDYPLPERLIAQTPARERVASRLMVVDRSDASIAHQRFSDLAGLLSPEHLLVLNDSRVFPARLVGRRPSGGRVEALLLRRLADHSWEVLLRPTRRLRPGDRLIFEAGRVEATLAASGDEARRRLHFECTVDLKEWIWRHGLMPLPPYIKRPRGGSPEDRERYQTVYAAREGSVAAPTAGLHFNRELLGGLPHVFVTLHVGYGTFQPVRVEDIRRHQMHQESYEISDEAAGRINRHRTAGGRLLAVGTTTTRVLESRVGREGGIRAGRGETDIFIRPGHRFRAVDALLTNFHLPRSTLLMLVAAFAGREFILECYREAIREEYRFFSYGDAMLIL